MSGVVLQFPIDALLIHCRSIPGSGVVKDFRCHRDDGCGSSAACLPETASEGKHRTLGNSFGKSSASPVAVKAIIAADFCFRSLAGVIFTVCRSALSHAPPFAPNLRKSATANGKAA